jgi:hypothetical protein
MVIHSDVSREAGRPVQSQGSAHRRLHQVMMLLTLLVSRKIILGGNVSFARVAGGEMRCGCQSWPMRLGGSVLGLFA